jgi:hypothetical protein
MVMVDLDPSLRFTLERLPTGSSENFRRLRSIAWRLKDRVTFLFDWHDLAANWRKRAKRPSVAWLPPFAGSCVAQQGDGRYDNVRQNNCQNNRQRMDV